MVQISFEIIKVNVHLYHQHYTNIVSRALKGILRISISSQQWSQCTGRRGRQNCRGSLVPTWSGQGHFGPVDQDDSARNWPHGHDPNVHRVCGVAIDQPVWWRRGDPRYNRQIPTYIKIPTYIPTYRYLLPTYIYIPPYIYTYIKRTNYLFKQATKNTWVQSDIWTPIVGI